MCGIAGSLGIQVNPEQISRCIDSLKYRGPNNSGFHIDQQTTLIHTRLSILDLSKNGNQPMVDTKSGVAIVYNGEIYNFKELQNLLDPNVKIKNDTVVVLNLYIKYGLDFVKKLRGMFAIAIWDPRIQALILIRDRFGIKPLYYYKSEKKIIFGSEIKAMNILGVEKKINYQSVKKYLKFGILEDNETTLIENVKPVEPGTIEYFSETNDKTITYWNLNKLIFDKNKDVKKYDDINSYVSCAINDAINSHLVSDVKVGLTLSSGIDSQILLKYVLKNNSNEINAFTYGYNEPIYDESKAIGNKIKDFNIKHYISKLNSIDMISELSEAIKYFGTPLGGLGTLSLYKLMKLIRKEGTPVVLSGEGADEVFGGYKYYFYAYIYELKKNKDFVKLNKEIYHWKKLTGENLSNIINSDENLKEKIYGLKAPDGTSLDNNNLEGNYLKEIKITQNFKHNNIKKDELRNVMLKDIYIEKLPKLLMFQDRCSMSSSIESRVPFLDHLLVENIFSLSPSLLIENGVLKYLLRKDLSNSRLFDYNDEVEKKYVATPQREWLKDSLYKNIFDLIINGNLAKNGIVDSKNFKKLYNDYHYSKELGNSFFVWKVLNLQLLFDN